MTSTNIIGEGPSENAFESGAVIELAGGGYTGITALKAALKHVEERWITAGRPDPENYPLITFRMYDATDPLSHNPYREPDAHLKLLNQTGEHQTDANREYIQWLIDEGHAASEEEAKFQFGTRELYGKWLDHVYEKTVKEAFEMATRLPVRIEEKIVARVTDIDMDQNTAAFSLTTETGEESEADVVLLGTGHVKNKLLSEFRDQPTYLEPPFSVEGIKKALGDKLNDPNATLLFVGSSQTSIDGIVMALEAGYKGKFDLYGSTRPWRFDPEKNSPAKLEIYKEPDFFKAETFSRGQWEYQDIINLLNNEITSADQQGIGKGIVLFRVFERKQEILQALIDNGVDQQTVDRFEHKLTSEYSNPSPPERVDLLEHLEEEGRLSFKSGRIGADNLAIQDNGQAVLDLPFEEQTAYDAIVNAASYARAVFDENGVPFDALLRKAFNKGLVTTGEDPRVLKAGEQRQGFGLYAIGAPLTSGDKWGAQSSEPHIVEAAENAVERAYKKFERRRAAAPRAAIFA